MNLSPETHKFALARNYFDNETEFTEEADPLLYQYACASFKAATHAMNFIATGEPASLSKARWYEAVAQTLEQVLRSYTSNLVGFELPPPPEVR